MKNNHIDICGTRFFLGDYEKILSIIKSSKNERTIIAPLATHPVMEAYFHSELKNIYKKIKYLLPDGYVVWAIHFLYGFPSQKRMYGPDLLINVSRMCEKTKQSLFLCGNNCEFVEHKLKNLFPNLIVGGTFEMKGKKYNTSIANRISQSIKKTDSTYVCIGIGSPNQHKLATELSVKLPIICVGAGFNLIAGIEKQAPLWIREIGLEWLYRLIQSPRRLWKRYIAFGPLFIYLVLLQRAKMLLSDKKT
jgi:exopolysaccharide biosynthesis WecB/TagA/CpsF family protein